jgi:hypothetical protein
MLNSGSRGKRARDGSGLIGTIEHFNQQSYLIPTVTGFQVTDISYNPLDDTAANTAGSQTIVITGTGFAPGATVMIGTTTIGAVTWLDQTRLTFTSPALSAGVYTIYVTNANGGTGILVQGLTYSGTPTFTTAAGSLGSYYETTSISTAVNATGDAPISYTVNSGSLPSGASLNSTTGAITGTAPVDSGSTTYTFQIKAGDGQFQESYATFSLTINTDVVTFPIANNTSYSYTQGLAIPPTSLASTSAAGYSQSYSATGLPTGLSLTSGVISGTPSVIQSTTSIITATAATSGRTGQLYLNWTISIANDTYWSVVPLMLSANTTYGSTTFMDNRSRFDPTANSLAIIAGDARPTGFSPYRDGYYSYFFDGSGDYLTTSAPAAGANDLTVEFWFFCVSTLGGVMFTTRSGNTSDGFQIQQDVGGEIRVGFAGSNFINTTAGFSVANKWYHVAVTKTGTGASQVMTLYVNGVLQGTSTQNFSFTSTNVGIGANRDSAGANPFRGYISNLRYVVGTAVYTTAFTPTTTPLLPVANTVLWTCRSNGIIDNSPLQYPITVSGDTRVLGFQPFPVYPPTSLTVAAENNQGVYFNGANNLINLTQSSSLAVGSGDFTFEFWFNTSTVPSTEVTFFESQTTNAFRIYKRATSGGLNYDFYGGTSYVIVSDANITLGRWHHVAVSRTSGTLSAYYDGVRVINQTDTTTGAAPTTSAYTVGARVNNSQNFTGSISNMRLVVGTGLYSGTTIPVPTTGLTAVSGTQLLICNSSTLSDKSTNAIAITPTGFDLKPKPIGPFTTTQTISLTGNEGAVYVDGSGDAIQVLSPPWTTFAGPFTTEAWMYSITKPVNKSAHLGQTTNGLAFYSSASGNWELNFAGTGTVLTTSKPIDVNVWTHVAFTRDNSNIFKVWVNGALSATSSTDARTFTQGNWTIGFSDIAHISDVRVTMGQALYTTPFIPSWNSFSALANTVLLTTQTRNAANNKQFVDYSSNNTVLLPTGNASNSSEHPFGENWSGYFGITGDYLTYPSSANFGFGTNDYTIEFWYFPMTASASLNNATAALLDFRPGTNGAGVAPAYIYFDTTNGYSLYYTAALKISSGTAAYTVGKWTHISISRRGGFTRMFINGLQVGTTLTDGNNYTAATTLRVGSPNDGVNPGTRGPGGLISNIRIINGTGLYIANNTPSTTPLTNQLANTMFLGCRSGNFNDVSSANNYPVTRTGAAVVKRQSPFNGYTSTPITYSTYFDGSSHMTVPNINLATNNFTIEGWFWINTIDANRNVWGMDNSTGANPKILLYFNASSSLVVDIGGTVTLTAVPATYGLYVKQWCHIAVVRTSTGAGGFALYINGRQAATATMATNLSTITAAFNIGYIGEASGSKLLGYVSNFRIVNGTGLYTADFEPQQIPLTPTQTLTDTRTTTGRSVSFNGSSQKLELPSNAAFTFGTGDFTIECWVYMNGTAGNYAIYDARTAGSSASINLYWQGTNNLSLMVNGTNVIATGYPMTALTWHHIALCRVSASTRLFVDGIQVGSTYSDTNSYNLGIPTIGSNSTSGGGGNWFPGYVSNLRVVKGQGLYSANFTPPTSPLTLTSQGISSGNVALLMAQSSTIVDNSNWAWTITNTGTTTVSDKSPFGYVVPAVTTNTTYILVNQSITGTDISGNNVVITYTGNTRPVIDNPFGFTYNSADYSTGNYGSINFDGSGDSIRCNTIPSIYNQPFTFEGWVKANTAGFTGYIHEASWGGSNFGLNVNGGVIRTTTGGVAQLTGTKVVDDLSWHHVAYVRESTSAGALKLYVDGILDVAGTDATSYGLGTGLWMGSDVGTTGNFNGNISNYRLSLGQAIYTRPFLPPRAPVAVANSTALLVSGNPSITDAASTTSMESIGGVKSTTHNSPFYDSFSNHFNGSSDYFTVGNTGSFNIMSNASNYTIEAWVFPTIAGVQQTIAAKDWLSGQYPSWGFTINSSNKLQLEVGSGTTSSAGYQALAGLTTVPLYTWSHVAVVVTSGTSCKFYLNGTLDNTVAITTPQGNGGGVIYVGQNGQSNLYFNGYISNLRITKSLVYTTSPFTLSTTPLTTTSQSVSSGNVGLLTCQSRNFVDNSASANPITTFNSAKITAFQPFVGSNLTPYKSMWFGTKTDYFGMRYDPRISNLPGDFSIECWVYPTDTSLTGEWGIIDARQTAGAAANWWFALSTYSSGWLVTLYTGTSNSSTGRVQPYRWTHVAVVRSGSTVTFYIDGSASGTATVSGALAGATSTQIYIGTKDNASATFGTVGYISDLRLTNGQARTISLPTGANAGK